MFPYIHGSFVRRPIWHMHLRNWPMDALAQIFAREIPFAGFDIKDIKDHVEAGKRPEFPVGDPLLVTLPYT